MDHSTAIIPEAVRVKANHFGAHLREIRRVITAVGAGDDGARVGHLADGPIADIGLALNAIIERHQRANERVRTLEEEVATVTRFRTEFLANVSHELRTPLNNLLILSGTLSQNQSHNLSDDQISYATTIYECGRDLLRMINDMLDLGTTKVPPTHRCDIKVATLVADMEQFFRPVAAEKGLAFSVTLGLTMPATLSIDAERVQQILFNLLSNAFKFTERGEVRLGIGRSGDVLNFSVTDTGIGVAAAEFESIFGAFQQVDGSINRGFGGTGLGLTISRELATALGGVIHVDSEVGRGSTFRLDLPMGGGALGL